MAMSKSWDLHNVVVKIRSLFCYCFLKHHGPILLSYRSCYVQSLRPELLPASGREKEKLGMRALLYILNIQRARSRERSIRASAARELLRDEAVAEGGKVERDSAVWEARDELQARKSPRFARN